jgi:hypothetical protein
MNVILNKFLISWSVLVEKCYTQNLIKYFIMISIADVLTTVMGYMINASEMSSYVQKLWELSNKYFYSWGVIIVFIIVFMSIKILIIYPFYHMQKKQPQNLNDFLIRVLVFDVLILIVAVQSIIVINNILVIQAIT